jgi:uncharacterized protein YukE
MTMAERVRINLSEAQNATSDLNTKAQDALDYINGELSALVTSFDSWWEGDAYNSFKDDFEATKRTFRTDIYDEILAYTRNLTTAVEAQAQQDTSNAGAIKIN